MNSLMQKTAQKSTTQESTTQNNQPENGAPESASSNPVITTSLKPSRTGDFKAKAAEKWNRLTRSLKKTHNISATGTHRSTHERAQRITAETVGVFAGAVKAGTAALAGVASGLACGVKGISPEAIRKIRMQDAELILIGSWVGERTMDGNTTLLVEQHKSLSGEELPETEAKAYPINGAERYSFAIDGEPVEANLIPLVKQDENKVVGYMLAELSGDGEQGQRRVFVYYDQDA